MECQVCKQREATVHLTQIVDDDTRSLDLCEGCAKQKGVSDPVGFALGDLLQDDITSVLGAIMAPGKGAKDPKEPGEPKEPREAKDAKGGQCGRCGMSHAEFKKTGRLGCSECYRVFGEALDSVLKGMHKGVRHVGKVPAGKAQEPGAPEPVAEAKDQPAGVPTPIPPDMEQLARDLAEAVGREDFEAAAKIRDAIRAAKKSGTGAKGGAA